MQQKHLESKALIIENFWVRYIGVKSYQRRASLCYVCFIFFNIKMYLKTKANIIKHKNAWKFERAISEGGIRRLVEHN